MAEPIIEGRPTCRRRRAKNSADAVNPPEANKSFFFGLIRGLGKEAAGC